MALQSIVAVFVPKGQDFPYPFFYLVAAFAAAWTGGYGPGIVASLMIVIGIPLVMAHGLRSASVDVSRVGLMLLVSALVSAVAESQRRSRKVLRDANEDLDRRVQSRTKDLAQAVESLESEVEQRKRTEEALRESEERVDFALDAAGIGRWDLDLGTRQVNRSLRHDQIFGYDRLLDTWTYETFLEHIVPEDRSSVGAKFNAAVEGHGDYDFECRIEHQDGAIRWVWARGKIRRDGAGKAVSLLGTVGDITDRKRAEQRLRTQLERMSLLDQITRSIGERLDLPSIFQVVVRSLEDSLPIDFGCICLYDPVAEALTVTGCGARSEQVATEIGMTHKARIDIDENGLSRCVRGQLVYEQDVSQIQFPFPQRLARGGLRSLVAAPLLFESKVFGILVAARRQVNGFESSDCEFLRQLSEHVALAAHQAQVYTALEQAYDDLRRTQQAVMQQERLRALGQMASGIAHDINNAISPVVLYTEMLLSNELNLSARGRQNLEIIGRAADDVAHTVSRMREFYHQDEAPTELVPVYLDQLVQHVLDLTRARWSDIPQSLGIVIKVQTELTRDLPAVAGIESEIREALTNLLLNAVDAMPEGGTLTLRVKPGASRDDAAKQNVHVEIEDTGIGMDEETRRRCLEPFFTTKGERGTGLGLAMVYGVARRHGAEIEIESTPGKGTTMRLSFPVPAPAEADLTPLAAATAAPSRLRILVVDDDPLLIKSLSDILESDGHAVTTANGGREGIQAFQMEDPNQQFDLVITDLGMPYVDGRKVATAIKTARASVPVILLTGWGQRLVAEGDLPAHVDRVLSKPPKLRDLRGALTELTSAPNKRASV